MGRKSRAAPNEITANVPNAPNIQQLSEHREDREEGRERGSNVRVRMKMKV